MKRASLILSVAALGTALLTTPLSAAGFQIPELDGWLLASGPSGDVIVPGGATNRPEDDIMIFFFEDELSADQKATITDAGLSDFLADYVSEVVDSSLKVTAWEDPEIDASGEFPVLTIIGHGRGSTKAKKTIDINFVNADKKKAKVSSAEAFLTRSAGQVIQIVIVATDAAYEKYSDDITTLFQELDFQ